MKQETMTKTELMNLCNSIKTEVKNNYIMTDEVQEIIMSIVKTYEGYVRTWMELGHARRMYFSSYLFSGSTIRALMDCGFVCVLENSFIYEDVTDLEIVLIVME